MINNMLNLQRLKIIDMHERESDNRFLVETALPPPTYCPKCGTIANLYKHDKKIQLFLDLPSYSPYFVMLFGRN